MYLIPLGVLSVQTRGQATLPFTQSVYTLRVKNAQKEGQKEIQILALKMKTV